MEALFDFFSNVSHQSVHFAINAVWVGLALTGLTWLLLRWAGRAAAGARLSLWWTVLLIVLALPLLATSPLGDLWNAVEVSADRSTPISAIPAVEEPLESSPVNGAHARTDRAPDAARPPVVASARPVGSEVATDNSPLAFRLIPLSLMLIWLGGGLLQAGRLGLAYRRMTRVKSRSEVFDIGHLTRLDRLLRAGRRRVEVRLSHDTAIPMAAGLGRPMILIPHRLAEALSDTELEAIILHELAHFNRWDDWSKLAQKLIEATFFFHPAIYIICHQLELERELACDEWAIAQTGTPDRYARCLTRLVQLTSGPATTLIPGALSSRKQIFLRFERLLVQTSSSWSRRRARVRLAAVVAVVGLTALFAVQVAPAIDLPLEPVLFAELSSLDKPDEVDSAEVEGTDERAGAQGVSSTPGTAPARVIGTAYVDGDKIYGATTRKQGPTVTTTYNAEGLEMSVTSSGEVKLSADSRHIEKLSPGAALEFTQIENSEKRNLLVQPGAGSDHDYTYTVNGEEQEFDHKAREWFAESLRYFVLKTGFGAEARLRDMLTDKGLGYCMSFIDDEVESHAQRYYYEQLMAFDHLGFRDLRRIRQHAGETLADEHDREYIRDLANRRIAYMRRYSRNEMPPQEAASAAAEAWSSEIESGYSWTADADDSWSTYDDNDDVGTTYVGKWSRRNRDRDTEGEWEARFSRSRSRLQLEMEDYDGDYRVGFPVSLAALEGLTREQIVDGADEVTFSYKRGSGTFHFTGGFGRGRGWGEFTFETSPEYVEALEALGYRTSRLTDWRLFELAIHDVSLEYIKAMSEQGLGRLRLDKLVGMRIHDIEPEFVAEFASLGYDRLDADELIAFAIHDVDPDFVKELSKLNVRGLDEDAIVQLSIHDIDPDFVREFAEIGYDGLSADKLVQFGIHDVDPELVRELKALNVRGIDEDAMVQLSIHDIDADYVREMAEIGYDGLSVDELVQFGIHDVDPDLVRELRDLNVRGLDEDAMVQLSIHDIDADFVREFAEIGYNDLSVDLLVQFGIHGVDPELVRELKDLNIRGLDEDAFVQLSIHGIDADFVREFVEIGYDRLSVDRLVEFGIHGVTPRYVKSLSELGYDDISPARLIEMKIQGVTPSFIRRAQRKGYDDLSPAELIEAKIHGYF